MKEIFEKLNEIKDEILLEKGANELRLFVLVARTDIDARWDILFSADWLEKTNSEKDLVYLIEKLKSKFDGNLDFLARIVVATPHEIFIKRLAKAIIRENGRESGEIVGLVTTADFTVKRLFVMYINFSDEEISAEGTVDGPLAVQKISDF